MESKYTWPREFYITDAEAEELYNTDDQLKVDVSPVAHESLIAEPYYEDERDSVYASADDDDEDNNVDADLDDSDEEEGSADWGNVDPQSGGFPTGNEPTAPGSAV